MAESITEKMRKMVGNTSHKSCCNSYCEGYKKKTKTEHIFIEISGWLSNKWGWRCMDCDRFTQVQSS